MVQKLSLLLVTGFLLTSCGGGGGGGGGNTGPQTGFSEISVISDFQDPTRTVPGYADSLRVTVTPPDGVTLPAGIPNPFTLTRSNKSRTLENLTPSGQPYVFQMEALTNNTVVGTATRSILANDGQTREVDVSANLTSTIASVSVEGVNAVQVGQNAQFTAFAKDTNGATLFSGAGFQWSSSGTNVLSVNPDTGLATANLLGNVTLTATLKGSVKSGSKNLAVNSNGGVSITINPPSASVLTGGTKQFSANVSGAGNTAVAWSITPVGQAGSVSGSGLYTASSNEGLYYVCATSVADPTAKAEAIVSVGSVNSQYRIAFTSDYDNNDNIFLCTLAGTNYERITTNPTNDLQPALSPDGSKIAFIRQDSSQNFGNLIVRNLSTGVETPLTTYSSGNPGEVKEVCWSSDTRLYFVTAVAIERIQVDGTGRANVVSHAGTPRAPSINAAGTKMVYQFEVNPGQWQWTMANIDGTNAQPIVVAGNLDGNNCPAAWSPDGTRLAICIDGWLRTYNAGTMAFVEQLPISSFDPRYGVAYSPDGQSVLYVGNDSNLNASTVFTIRLSDKHYFRLTDFGGDVRDMTVGIRQ